ncbi:MAG: hypothetical protein KC466_02640, partial [Myxococcales bacterium]|nr:hypothetical protein [Myxococcales bacterium]
MNARARSLPTFVLVAATLAAVGCSDTQFRFDLSGGGGFYDLPFPTDLRLDAEGRPDLSGFPNPTANAVVDLLTTVAHEDARGWSTGMPVYLAFTAPIDTPQLPEDPRAFEDPASPIQLIDVDPASPERGRRFPLRVTLNPFDQSYRVGNLLEIIPVLGVELREETTYAVIVTDDAPTLGFSTLVANPDLTAVLFGLNPGGALGAEAVDVYAPLRDQLALEGVNPATVAAATVFTTGDVVKATFDLSQHVVENYDVSLENLEVDPDDGADHDRFCEIIGTVDFPQFQQGTPPFDTEGLFELGSDGMPIEQRKETAKIVIT